ncbi:MAG: YggT family protein [Nitrospinota bacterium]
MFVLANLLGAVAFILDWVLWIYLWMVLIRVILSWVRHLPSNYQVRMFMHSLAEILDSFTEPVLAPIRYRLPTGLGLDFSPVVVILAIYFLQRFLVASLHQIAVRLQ